MNHGAKNKVLTWLVVLLVIANAVTITLFWLGRGRLLPKGKGTPQEFLVKQLKLDAGQQATFEVLRKEHHDSAMILREDVKQAKESFFDLLKQANVTDSMKLAAANKVSAITQQLDLLTWNHFQKLRAICIGEQQQQFDKIIQQVIEMIAHPQQPGRRDGNRPPREGGDSNRPPLPGGPDGQGPPPPPQN
jgi:periplasmic protein CpxP/Spy